MKTLTFPGAYRIGKLQEELVAAIPGLAARLMPGDERPTASFRISSDGETLTLEVPKDVDELAIAIVVDAHDPTTPSPTEAEAARLEQNERAIGQALRDRLQDLAALVAKLEAGTITANEQRQLLGLCAHGVIRLTKLSQQLLTDTAVTPGVQPRPGQAADHPAPGRP